MAPALRVTDPYTNESPGLSPAVRPSFPQLYSPVMSAVVYRAPDRELNLNESDKSWWGNTQTLIAGLCVGEANRRRDGVKKNRLQSVNQVQKDGHDGFFGFVWLAEMIEGVTIFLLLFFRFL